MVRIAFISDVHIGPPGYHLGVQRKLTEYAEPYLREFVDFIVQAGDIAFGLQLGDLIEDIDPVSDRANYQKGVSILNSSPIPIHHLIGNHEVVNLSPAELRTMLGLRSLYYSFDEGPYHFIVLRTLPPVPDTSGIILPPEQVDWLQRDLAATDKPSFVFSHHSFADQDLTGNPWFDGLPQECLVANREQVRKMLAASGKVVAVVNGHLHWNHVDWHAGIPYITVQSSTENMGQSGIPAHAWGVMEIHDNCYRLTQYGREPFEHQHEFSVKAG